MGLQRKGMMMISSVMYLFFCRELQRIQAISRGPIYSHFHETLEGLSTIRAFREQNRFTNQMLQTLDSHNKADMFINVGNRWLSISLVRSFNGVLYKIYYTNYNNLSQNNFCFLKRGFLLLYMPSLYFIHTNF